MIDMLHYGLEDDGIRIDMPQYAFDAAIDSAAHFSRIVDHPLAKQFVEADRRDGGTSLLLNTDRLGVLRDHWIQSERARAMTYVATMATAYTDPVDHDPDVLFVNMSLDRVGDGDRFAMEAGLNRWIEASHDAEATATRAMGKTALNLKYLSGREVRESVVARVDTALGANLQTNALAGGSLGTDGDEYSPEDTTIYLHGHNIYDRQTQLILLSGVIALAKS